MRLKEFRVTNFRNIHDSGWVDIEKTTALVGRNESGKTNLLTALGSLADRDNEPVYARERDFPADRLRSEYSDELDVIHTRWELTEDEKAEFEAIAPAQAAQGLIEVSRGYQGQARVHLAGSDPVTGPEDQAKDGVRQLEASFPEDARDDRSLVLALEAIARRVAEPCTDRRVWNEGLRSSLELLATALQQSSVQLPEEARAARDGLAELAEEQGSESQDVANASRWVLERLPHFIHVDQVPDIDGKMNLREFKRRQEEGTPELGDAEFGLLLKMAGIDDGVLDELMNAELEIRRQIVGQAGALVTRRIRAVWSDRPLKVRFYLDGDQLNTLVCEPTDFSDLEVNLNQRSRGFRWFFSFCVIVNGSQDEADDRGICLLLDEPGLHLHPVGQADLIQYLSGIEAPALLTTQARALLPSGPGTSVLAVSYDLENGAKVSTGPVDLGPDSELLAAPEPASSEEEPTESVAEAKADATSTESASDADPSPEAAPEESSEANAGSEDAPTADAESAEPSIDSDSEAVMTTVTVDAATGQLTSPDATPGTSTEDGGVVFEVEGGASDSTEAPAEPPVAPVEPPAPVITHEVVSLDDVSSTILTGLVGSEPALLVENLSDFWYLRAASDYLVSQGRKGLPEGIAPLPVGKSQYLALVATASRQAGNPAVVVVGTRPWSELEASLGESASLIAPGYVYAGEAHEEEMPGRCDIEDLVDSRVYERFVTVTYGKDLPEAEFVFDAEELSMIARCEKALEPHELRFVRTRPAKLVANGSERNVRAFLSGQTASRFEKLFEMIEEGFRVANLEGLAQTEVKAEESTESAENAETAEPTLLAGGADILDEAAEAVRVDIANGDTNESTRVSGLEPMGDPSGADALAAAMQEAADAVDEDSSPDAPSSNPFLTSDDSDSEKSGDGDDTMSGRRSGWGADEPVF